MHILEIFELNEKTEYDINILLDGIRVFFKLHNEYKENEKILKRIIFFFLEYKFTTMKGIRRFD